jgi:hypothetical protein
MQTTLSDVPRDMQQEAARHLRHTLEHSLQPSVQAILGEQAEGTTRLRQNCRNRSGNSASPSHYHCDQLGTPMVLTDQTGQVAWAASWTPGAMCCRNTTRRASTRRSGCRGSTMTGRRGCITTGIGITIRWWGAISIRIRSG